MKKKIWIPVVLIAIMLISLLTAYNCSKSYGNGADGETFLEFVNRVGSSITGKAFYMPPEAEDVPQKNSSSKSSAIARNAPKTKTIVVSGVGKTMKEAKKDALNKAYKRSGVLFSSSVSYRSGGGKADEMTENYTEITDVIVENYEVISTKLIDGVVNVKLRVTLSNVPSARKGKVL